MTTTQQTMMETIARVFETQAFMFLEPAEREDLEAREGPFLKSRLCFQGPSIGTVTLMMPLSDTPELAANLLGLEPDDPEAAESASDALGEILNVICGQLVTDCYGTTDVYRLSVPDVDSVADWTVPLGRSDALPCSVDGIPLLFLSEGLAA